MARKIKPQALRFGINTSWSSKWLFTKSRKYFLEEDCLIRKFIKEKLPNAGIADISIERTSEDVVVSVRSNRPGLVIGRRGKGIEDLKNELEKEMKALREKRGFREDFNLRLNVVELRRTEISAPVIAAQIASDIERYIPYRTVMKRYLRLIKQNREIKGAKIKISGRLNGAEIARSAWLASGRMPLNTLRASIDYGEATAFNTYGTVGIKVWLYKGEVFDND